LVEEINLRPKVFNIFLILKLIFKKKILKVCDFGISKILDKGDTIKGRSKFGTTLYCSPEYLLGPEYNWSADSFSFDFLPYILSYNNCI
jgi:serine/threonine protein kinase